MKKEENFIWQNYIMIDEYCDCDFQIWDPVQGHCTWPIEEIEISLEEIVWPDYLNSNSRRLIHHTNVKLFPNCVLIVPCSIERFFKTKRELDLLWKTFKHFGDVRFGDELGTQTAARFFQRLWDNIQGPSQLVRKLEKRYT